MNSETELITTDIEAYLARQEEKSLLRFITCGSVDDGKSTLIGRLLWDSRMVLEDQMAVLEAESRKIGTRGGEIDYALLLDGLQAEREQGITIDVAYRFFSTGKRKFIVADTPGHEQYTRNMVTGASTADLAVILVDARKGILSQTRRHTFLVSLVGIRHVVLAINKMDLVGYDRLRYETITDEYRRLADLSGFRSVTAIPISAVNGDNIVTPGDKTPWYAGPTLLEFLETVPVEESDSARPFRMPVQWVNRPDAGFRGYCGTIASGTLHAGDRIRVEPSGKVGRVARIVTGDGDIPDAAANMAVTVTLEEEIDISRGDLLVTPDAPPFVTRHPQAHLVWLGEEPLQPGEIYLIKSATLTTPGRIVAIDYAIDMTTFQHHQLPAVGLNDIAVVTMELDFPVPWDRYSDNRTTGSFIVIDRYSNATVGAGMIISPSEPPRVGALTTPHPTKELTAGGPTVIMLDASESYDLSGAGPSISFEVTAPFVSHLGRGNRVRMRVTRDEQMLAVLTLAREQTLAFECDPGGGEISVVLFRRNTPIPRYRGDQGGGI
ncbi:MAG: hypothetical protein Fur0034_13180 [Desulfuromonadia bacterium]